MLSELLNLVLPLAVGQGLPVPSSHRESRVHRLLRSPPSCGPGPPHPPWADRDQHHFGTRNS